MVSLNNFIRIRVLSFIISLKRNPYLYQNSEKDFLKQCCYIKVTAPENTSYGSVSRVKEL